MQRKSFLIITLEEPLQGQKLLKAELGRGWTSQNKGKVSFHINKIFEGFTPERNQKLFVICDADEYHKKTYENGGLLHVSGTINVECLLLPSTSKLNGKKGICGVATTSTSSDK